MPSDMDIKKRAVEFSTKKANKKAIAAKYVDRFPTESEAVSVFMAGSPGAGKTESAKELIRQFESETLRIDIDELRTEFSEYDGTNSYLFQSAAICFVEALHDRALKQGVSFVMDSTLSSFEIAKSNIERSLNKGRLVTIIFVYQKPELAWEFVQAREKVEGRKVPAEVFIEQFIGSQETANKLKLHFKEAIQLHVIVKNLDGSSRFTHFNVNSIDQYLDSKYDLASLNQVVSMPPEENN